MKTKNTLPWHSMAFTWHPRLLFIHLLCLLPNPLTLRSPATQAFSFFPGSCSSPPCCIPICSDLSLLFLFFWGKLHCHSFWLLQASSGSLNCFIVFPSSSRFHACNRVIKWLPCPPGWIFQQEWFSCMYPPHTLHTARHVVELYHMFITLIINMAWLQSLDQNIAKEVYTQL